MRFDCAPHLQCAEAETAIWEIGRKAGDQLAGLRSCTIKLLVNDAGTDHFSLFQPERVLT